MSNKDRKKLRINIKKLKSRGLDFNLRFRDGYIYLSSPESNFKVVEGRDGYSEVKAILEYALHLTN